jgi:hypothetical protein
MLSDSDIRERLGPFNDSAPDPNQSPGFKHTAGQIAALAILVVLLWVGGIALLVHLEKICPHLPDPRSGHIYRVTDTRRVFYLTVDERYTAIGALGAPLLGTLAFVIFAFSRKPRPGESY